jgi:serine/threonine protein kinase
VIGTRLGPFEITAKLGEGGMGEVYRATDSKLKREVAIKVLPPAFTADPERLARFEREAQILAQLHHPNIASIFGLEDSGGVQALVMELVEGPTLAERLTSGPLPLEDVLTVAKQIAEAFEAAHEKGIVHRDLKPQNIKLTADGNVKVLDFGLAKALDPSASSSAADLARSPTIMNSPTLTAAGTQLGVILGTAAYMAPEQARGGTVDKRADIWAFGVVLYEMLSGRSLFSGPTVSDTLAGVLKTEIDWRSLRPETPAAIRTLLRRCLERDPRKRLHDVADARIVLEEALSGEREENAPTAALGRRSRWLPWTIAALASIAAAVIAIVAPRAPSAEPQRVLRFDLAPPASSTPTRRSSSFQLSPDGRFLAMAAEGELWVRPLDAVAARRLEGIENATYPFWSPDGEWLGYFADRKLMKVARDGGRPQKVCDAPESRGGTWGTDGVIVFSDRWGRLGLSRVSAQGGAPAPLTHIADGESKEYHRYPQFLPGGKSVLFQVLSPTPELAGIYVMALDGASPQRVLEGGDQAVYVSAGADPARGYLLFRREDTLMAQPFDLAGRKAAGEALPVTDGVGDGPNSGAGAFSVSANGTLAFSDTLERAGELVWIDREGKRLGAANAETREMQGVALAPGGGRVAFAAIDSTSQFDVWIQSLPGGEPSRFTFGPPPGWAYPIWSPDGRELAYVTADFVGYPRYEIRRRRADRAGGEEPLLSLPSTLYLWTWSPDGTSLLYGDERGDLWLLPLAGERKPLLFIDAPGQQVYAQYSPDGRYIAYSSDEQGQLDVFVATVPPSGAIWQISAGGGTMPRWRRDGSELYFRANDGRLMAVEIGAAGIDGRSAPKPLFSGIPSSGNTPIFTYCPADDGQRFLVAATRNSQQPPITLVVNWPATLQARAAGGTP